MLSQVRFARAGETSVVENHLNEILYFVDEISSDSGVSEPDAKSTDRQLHYTTLKAIIKRKKYFEGQIKVLEDRIMVMGDHKKDIQVVHDLFDLHNDELDKVERSNGGLPCLESLKSILGKKYLMCIYNFITVHSGTEDLSLTLC